MFETTGIRTVEATEEAYNPNLKVELIEPYSTFSPDKAVAFAARGDHMDDSLVDTMFSEAMEGTNLDHQEFLDRLVQRGHWGPFEHPKAFIAVEGMSYFSHAYLVRHRHMSFDVQSQRYVNVEDADVTIPPSFEKVEDEDHFPRGEGKERGEVMVAAAKQFYEMLLDSGVDYGDARALLPQGLQVNMTFSANLRSLFHFLDLRENAKAHPEAVQFSKMLRHVLEQWAPKSMQAYEENTNNNSLRAP